MAATVRASSFLPTIKCSQCGVEIPISHMGDHVCSQGPTSQTAADVLDASSPSAAFPVPEPRSRALDGPVAPSTRVPMGPAPSTLRSAMPPPVRSNTIDTSASARSTSGSALRNVVPIDELQPPPRPPFPSNNTISNSGRTSPVPSLSGRKSPHRKITRAATAPMAQRPPSPAATPLPQDSAFPIFPTVKSRSTTPTTPHKTTFGFLPESKEDTGTRDGNPPPSPPQNRGEVFLQRMNTVAAEPFNAQGLEVRRPSGADGALATNKGLEFTRSASTSTARSRVRALSTSSSNYTRNPSMSSVAGYIRLDLDESDVPAVPTIPSVALDYDTSQKQGEEPTNRYTAGVSPFDFGSFGPSNRAHTFPEDPKLEELPRRPSDPIHTSSAQEQQNVSRPSNAPVKTHVSKPSVMLPLYDIGSTSSFKPSKSLRGRRNGSPAVGQLDAGRLKKTIAQEDERLEDAPPVPQPSTTKIYDLSNPYHTPHESVSSNESYGSGAKSGSSRSSPPLNSPLNSSSPEQKGHFGSDGFNDAFRGFQFGVENQPAAEQSVPIGGTVPPTAALDQRSVPFESQEPSLPNLSDPSRSVRPTTPLEIQEPSVPILSSPPRSTRPTTPLELQQPSVPILSSPPRSMRPITPSESHTLSSPPRSIRPTTPLASQEPTLPTLRSPPHSLRPVKHLPAPLQDVPMRPTIPAMASPDGYLSSPASPFVDLTRNIRLSPGLPPPPPNPESSARKRTRASKGPCRGCNAAIYGKSISSADGQLTGRYHKQCFVCKTCSAPFQTIDFYVYDNNPYCGRHYHEQNGSLCTNCDRGIEGQYLETDQRQKYHPFCFTCQECHLILRDDFYEWNNRILCEQHAFGDAQRAAQQPSSLGPGRRYPERRTTKLMIM